MVDGLAPQLGHIREGRVRPLGITTKARTPFLPDLPTIAETLPGFEFPMWVAVFAPGQDAEADRRQAVGRDRRHLQDPSTRKRYADLLVEPVGSTPQELDRFFEEQLAFNKDVIEKANIRRPNERAKSKQRIGRPCCAASERILTTHCGSLPRPPHLSDLLLRQEAGEEIDEALLHRESASRGGRRAGAPARGRDRYRQRRRAAARRLLDVCAAAHGQGSAANRSGRRRSITTSFRCSRRCARRGRASQPHRQPAQRDRAGAIRPSRSCAWRMRHVPRRARPSSRTSPPKRS